MPIPVLMPHTVVLLLNVGESEITPVDGLNDQLPPLVASPSTVHCPAHIDVVPVIGAGDACTVTVFDAKQPPPLVNITVSTPADTPVSTPVVATILAWLLTTENVLVPSGSVRFMVNPTHTLLGPEIADGAGSTRNVSHLWQPLDDKVKHTVVVSAANGIKSARGIIVPAAGLVEYHAPAPPLGSARTTSPADRHTACGGSIFPGSPFIVIE